MFQLLRAWHLFVRSVYLIIVHFLGCMAVRTLSCTLFWFKKFHFYRNWGMHTVLRNWFALLLILFIMQPKPLKNQNGQGCQICGDTVGVTATGEVFVACNECAFPVCRPCYEYERKDGNQSCPQCKTRYKRQKGQLIFCNFCCFCTFYVGVEFN